MFKKISNYIIYILLIISALLVILLGSFSFMWSNIGNYQRPIKTFIANQIGFKLDFKEIHGNIDFNFEPDITLKDLTVTDIKTNTPIITINKLFARLSISSLLHLEPILSKLEINGANLNFELDKKNNILLNKYVLTNLDDKESSSIDYEKYLLIQNNIELKNLNLQLTDSKHELLPIKLNKFGLKLKNHRLFNSHDIDLNFLLESNVQVHALLNQHGDRLLDTKYWKKAEFSLSTADESGHTILAAAKLTDYKLDYFNLNFNTTTQHLKQVDDSIRGNTLISGMLSITKNTESGYTIKGDKLNINTLAGNILNNAKLSGQYVNKQGVIKLDQINLNGISSIKPLNIYDKYKLVGTIKNINYNFAGNVFAPDKFSLSAELSNFMASALLKNYPSIDNISANINLTEKDAQIVTQLKNTKINYPKHLKNPLLINNALFNIKLNSPNNKYLSQVDIESSYINNSDLSLSINSLINLDKNSLQLDAKIKQFNLVNLYKYLPLSMGESTIKEVQRNIIGGYLNNLHLMINSQFKQLPESGLILTMDINNLAYKLDKNLVPLKNINAKASLINNTIVIDSSGFNLGAYKFSKANLKINQLYNESSILTFDLSGNGYTQSLIDVIMHSDYQEYLANTPTFIMNGNNQINLELKSPLHNFDKLTLKAKLKLINNSVSFDSHYPHISNIDGDFNLNQNGIEYSEIHADTLNSRLLLTLHNNEYLSLSSESFNYAGLYGYWVNESSNLVSGYSDLAIDYDKRSESMVFYSSLNGLSINAPVPLGKLAANSKPLTIEYKYNTLHNNSLINLDYTNAVKGDIILDKNFDPQVVKLAIGDTIVPNTIDKYYIKANVSETRVIDWIDFVNKLSADFKSVDNTQSDTKQNTPALANRKIFFDWTTSSVWLDTYNIDGGNLNGSITDSIVNLNFDFSDIYGNINYYLDNNFVNINLNKLIINTKNFVDNSSIESKIVNLSKRAQVVQDNKTQFVSKRGSTRKEDRNQANNDDAESNFFNESQIYVDTRDINTPKINIPDIKIFIKNLYFENHYLGTLQTNVVQRNNNLYIESASVTNQISTTIFRVIEHNVNPDGSKVHYTDLRLRTNIKNLGKLFTKLNLGDDLKGGNGLLDVTLNWGGGIKDFNLYRNKGKISMHVKNGTFTEIKPGLFGSLFGVVSLTSITHASQLNMNTFFGQGVTFEDWTTNLDLIYNRLDVKNLTLTSPSATIKSFGTVNIQNMMLDSYLTVEPRLGATVATTAGIVTLNPIIGLFVYAGSAIIGNPVNKLLAISYHITGTVDNPKMQKVNLNDQIQHNFGSSTNITQVAKDTADQINGTNN